ncbi:MAG: DUF4258 domain-containing protein [Planctomycetota bacterium]|jgi:hypothetical protein
MDTFGFSFFWAAIKESGRVTALFLPIIMQLLNPCLVWAHSALDDCIHHRINLKADSNNVDITVELFFHAHRSQEERCLMDDDLDNHITRGEIREYLNSRKEQFRKGIGLSIDGRPLRVIRLYRPDLELHNVRSTRDHPHSLRLYYFARTPKWLKPDSVITLEDNLWPRAPAICSLFVQSKGTFRSSVGARAASLLSARAFGGSRQIRIRPSVTLLSGSNDYRKQEKCAASNRFSNPKRDRPVPKVPITHCERNESKSRSTQKQGDSP